MELADCVLDMIRFMFKASIKQQIVSKSQVPVSHEDFLRSLVGMMEAAED